MIFTDRIHPLASEDSECIEDVRREFPELQELLRALLVPDCNKSSQAIDSLHKAYDGFYAISRRARARQFVFVYSIVVLLGSMSETVRSRALDRLNQKERRAGRSLSSTVLHTLQAYIDDPSERNRNSKRLSTVAKAMDYCLRQKWSPSDVTFYYESVGHGIDAWSRLESKLCKLRDEPGSAVRDLPTLRELPPRWEGCLPGDECVNIEERAERQERQAMISELTIRLRQRHELEILQGNLEVSLHPPLNLSESQEIVLWLQVKDTRRVRLRGLRLLGSRKPSAEELEELLDALVMRRG